MNFWESPDWEAYEVAYGDAPGTRARLLQEARWQTRLIDLSKSEEQLWKDVRRSYRATIKKGMTDRNLDVTFLTPHVYLEHAKALHIRQAGRQTRSDETWDLQAQWLKSGQAFGVAAWRARENSEVRMVGFAFTAGDREAHYYFSGASSEPDVQHLLQWALIRNLRENGIRRYEIGWQGEAQDEKGKHIEFFRSGFGGDDMAADWRWRL